MTNAALIAHLENAKGGSRELSKGVLRALGYRFSGKWWVVASGPYISQKSDPTRNLQDAVDLVPNGWIVADLRQRINPPI